MTIINSLISFFRDVYHRILGRQKCILFDNEYIDIIRLEQYKKIFDDNFMISVADNEGIITFTNNKFLKSHNLTKEDTKGKTHRIIKSKTTTPEEFKELWNTITDGKNWSGKLSFMDTDKLKFLSVNIFPVFDKNNKIIEFISLRDDITDIVQLERDVESAQRELIIMLSTIIEGKDSYLKYHILRVSEYAQLLSELYGLEHDKVYNIKMVSPLHDVGKVAVHDNILAAERRLTDEEFEEIKRHSSMGYNLFKDSEFSLIKLAATIAYEHHENWDGSGYPRGLKGEEISIEGRIVGFADVFDALTSKRVYKRAWTIEEVDKFILDSKGTKFEPKIVDLYFDNKKEFLKILNRIYED